MKGNKGGTGNPGYGYNQRVIRVIGLSADRALDIFASTDPKDELKKDEIMLKMLPKAVPQNIKIEEELPSERELPFTKEEKDLYVKIRLGKLEQALKRSTEGESADLGDG